MRKILIALVLVVAVSACAPTRQAPQQQVGNSYAQNAGNPNVQVWVNTNSGIYHCPRTRWYGATKQGEYMTQKQAQDKGNRPAYGRLCR